MLENQFKRIMSLMLRDANEVLHILKTGEIPEDNSEAEMLAMLEEKEILNEDKFLELMA